VSSFPASPDEELICVFLAASPERSLSSPSTQSPILPIVPDDLRYLLTARVSILPSKDTNESYVGITASSTFAASSSFADPSAGILQAEKRVLIYRSIKRESPSRNSGRQPTRCTADRLLDQRLAL